MASVKYGPKVCTICGKKYQGIFNSIYCSKECKDKRNLAVWHERNPRPIRKRICLTCGKEFVAESQNQKTCSLECRKKRYAEDWKKSYDKRMSTPAKRERRRELAHANYELHKEDRLARHHERIIQKKQELAQSLQTEPVIENNNGNIRQEFIKNLGIKRLSERGCECLRCGNKFNLRCAKSVAIQVLKRLSVSGKSPCPYCGEAPTGTSGRASSVEMVLKRAYPNFTVQSYRPDWMEGMEIDLYDPEAHVGLEFHGIKWHSTAVMDNCKASKVHKHKADLCEKNGVHLIQLYETEWEQKREIVKDKLDAIFHKDMKRLFARKLKVTILGDRESRTSAMKFLDKNHIQGRTACQWAVGLLDGLELVAVCTFKYGTAYSIGGQKDGTEKYWELNRYATKLGYSIVGGLSKCIKSFAKAHPEVRKIVSFADRRWTSRLKNTYSSSGFVEVAECEPNYQYTDLDKRHELKNKQYMRKSQIAERATREGSPESAVYSPDKTESQMSKELGYYRVYDAGKIRYEMTL